MSARMELQTSTNFFVEKNFSTNFFVDVAAYKLPAVRMDAGRSRFTEGQFWNGGSAFGFSA
jgi:hypothetical protein